MSTQNTAGKKDSPLRGLVGITFTGQKKEEVDPLLFDSENLTGGDGSPGKRAQAARSADSAEESVARKPGAPRLIQTLLDEGVATKDQIDTALETQGKGAGKKRFIEILIDDLGADRERVLKTVARYYSFESVDPTPIFGNKERLQFIRQLLDALAPANYDLAVKLKVLPFELFSNGYDKLTVITPDTTHPSVHTIARAFKYPKYEIKHVPTPVWTELWRQLAFDQGAKQLGMEPEDGFAEYDRLETEKEIEKTLEDEMGRGRLNDLIEGVLADGVRTGASDIHVIPKSSHRTEFHFRIDGRLSLWSAITDVRSEAVITVVKDRGKNLDRFERLLSQDGFAQRTIDNKQIRFRFSTMPIHSGDLGSKLESR